MFSVIQELFNSFIYIYNNDSFKDNLEDVNGRKDNGVLISNDLSNNNIGSINDNISPDNYLMSLAQQQANDIWDERSLEFLYNFQRETSLCEDLLYEQKQQDGNNENTSYLSLMVHETALLEGPATIPIKEELIPFFKEDIERAKVRINELKTGYNNLDFFNNIQLCIDPFTDRENIPNSDGMLTVQGFIMALPNNESNRDKLERIKVVLAEQHGEGFFIRLSNTEGEG